MRLLLLPLHGGLLILTVALAPQGTLYQLALIAQSGFYLAAIAGFLLRERRGAHWPLAAPYMICLLAWATGVAFARFVAGRQTVRWERVRAHG